MTLSLLRPSQRVTCNAVLRSFSTQQSLVVSNVHEDSGVAILAMNRPPANSLSLEMNEAISASLKEIESNPHVQSVILSSSNPTIFSAGLDITELISPSADRLPKFWNSLQQVFVDLYGSRLATIAAIQGHAPAAGCMLALACDYRIMYGGHDEGTINGEKQRKHMPAIGFNETQLGIAAPPWMGQQMVQTIGFRKAERALALGTLFPPVQALAEGVIDEVVTEQLSDTHEVLQALVPDVIQNQASNAVMQRAFKEATRYAKIPSQARVASKLVTRSESLKAMEKTREADTQHFCGFITQEVVQKNLMIYVEGLKQKSKGKK